MVAKLSFNAGNNEHTIVKTKMFEVCHKLAVLEKIETRESRSGQGYTMIYGTHNY